MGGNISKSGGDCVYSTPRRLPPDDLVIDISQSENSYTNPDPRSPHICRTPIDKVLKKSHTENENYEMRKITSPEFQNPSSLLKNKLIKELELNLNDPRSPSQFINRTPIVFDESALTSSNIEDSLNLDEQFCDLFIDKIVDKKENSQNNCIIDERDPRSPSINVERTPIIITDDSPNENDAIESVLEVLSLGKTVLNKPLERVKNAKRSRINKKKVIYEDSEQVYSTPKKSGGPTPKRTPLSCVANKSHLRSRSVDNSNKSKRPKLPPISYDDNIIKPLKLDTFENSENTENAF